MKRIILFTIIISVFCIKIKSKVHMPQDRSKFYKLLDQRLGDLDNLAIVHFVKHDHGKEKSKNLEDMQADFHQLSRDVDYKNAGLLFIGVNVNDIPSLSTAFNLADDSTFLLFKNGRVVIDNKDKAVALIGFVDKQAIQQFIEQQIGEDVDQNLQHALQTMPRRMQRRVKSVYYDYDYPYYYGYRPYYGGYYGYGYPYYGAGVGFGTGGIGFGVGIGF